MSANSTFQQGQLDAEPVVLNVFDVQRVQLAVNVIQLHQIVLVVLHVSNISVDRNIAHQ